MANWLITGVSSGFGLELARAALARGDTVVGTVRQAAQADRFEQLAPGRAHALLLDVTRIDEVEPAVQKALKLAGTIDVLVNNAGYGLFGAIEEVSDAEGRQVMDTNLFGPLAVDACAAAAPARAARRAHLQRRLGGRRDRLSRLRPVCRLEVRAGRRDRGAGDRAGALRHPRDDRRAGRLPHAASPAARMRQAALRDRGLCRHARRTRRATTSPTTTATSRATRPRRRPRSSGRWRRRSRRCGWCSVPTRSACCAGPTKRRLKQLAEWEAVSVATAFDAGQ